MFDYSWLLSQIDSKVVLDAIIFVIIFAVVVLIFSLLKQIVLANIRRVTRRTETDVDDALVAIFDLWDVKVWAVLTLFIMSRAYDTPELLQQAVSILTMIGVTWFFVKSVNYVLMYATSKYVMKRQKEEDQFDPTLLNFLKRIVQGVIWVVGGLLVLQNLGFEVSALLGGLGLGGLAVAFAVQNLLSDVFSSFSIYFDKPFQMGDTIRIGTDVGTVKKVGIKSTRLQTLDGQELVISNKELTEARIHNFKRMPKRRVVFILGVEYETARTKVAKIPELVTRVFDDVDKADLERVHLVDLADYSINYEVVYYIPDRDFELYRDVHQKVLLAILETLAKHKVGLAYPTQRMVE